VDRYGGPGSGGRNHRQYSLRLPTEDGQAELAWVAGDIAGRFTGLSRTVSDINGDFSRKSQIIPTSVYFAPH